MLLTWDPQKALINIEKHGVSFETASHVFDDLYCCYIFDELHSVDEERFNAIGKVDNILFVVFTERQDTMRLISARAATKKEEEMYYAQIQNSLPR